MIHPRRRFVLQNVASGGYATATPNNNRGPNILHQSDLKAASTWYFHHFVQDNYQGDDMFALMTGSGLDLCSLDAYGGCHVSANAERCNITNVHHMWKALPRDGGFVFRNLATGTLLAKPAAHPLVHFANPAQFAMPTCQWRLLDPATGVVCPVLYDSALAVPLPQLAAPLTGAAQPQECPQELALRTAEATPTVRRLFADGLTHEHNMVREMLRAGYTSLMLAPRLITNWKNGGGLHDISLKDEDDAFSVNKFRSFNACDPR